MGALESLKTRLESGLPLDEALATNYIQLNLNEPEVRAFLLEYKRAHPEAARATFSRPPRLRTGKSVFLTIRIPKQLYEQLESKGGKIRRTIIDLLETYVDDFQLTQKDVTHD